MLEVALYLGGLVDHTLYNSLGYILVALGVLICIRFMGFPDLTADGSFTLGACGYAVAIKAHVPLPLALGAACILGVMAGTATAFVNQFLKVGKIISSILVMIVAVTITPYLAGNSTLGLLVSSPLINQMNTMDIALSKALLGGGQLTAHPTMILFFMAFTAVLIMASGYMFKSRLGIRMRYLGSAPVPGLIAASARKLLLAAGLATGNGMIAMGGAVEAERNGGFSSGMGLGALLIGLTILVLGEGLMKIRLRRDFLSVNESLLAVVVGVCVYSLGVQLVLSAGFYFVDVRLLSTIFLLGALTMSSYFHPNSTKLF